MSMNQLKKVVAGILGPDEKAVKYEHTYEKVRNWLINPVPKGCGFDPMLVDKILPLVVMDVRDGKLAFNRAIDFHVYLRKELQRITDNEMNAVAKIREESFWSEFAGHQVDGLKLLKRWKRERTWLLIFMGFALAVLTLVLLRVVPY